MIITLSFLLPVVLLFRFISNVLSLFLLLLVLLRSYCLCLIRKQDWNRRTQPSNLQEEVSYGVLCFDHEIGMFEGVLCDAYENIML